MSVDATTREVDPFDRPQPCYRVHFLDPDGRVSRIKPLDAASDAEAIQLTRGLMDGRALDLWEGLRFIEYFPILDETVSG